ncbi:MAG: RIP metalloprotease RseP [Desulfobacterales bacterium]|jgi:regulator of sigma E protease
MGTNIFAFIIVLGVLIFFHEFGHFLIARVFGVGVEKFSLGFGPRLIGKKVGITDYRLSAIPLGGYVKMVGEEPDAQVAPQDLPLSFTHKHVAKRMLIVAAGPVFNILLAVIIFFGIFFFTGTLILKPSIGSVRAGSPALAAGLEKGDLITQINGSPINSWDEMAEIINASRGRALHLSVRRQDATLDFSLTPAKVTTKNIFGEDVQRYVIGITASGESFSKEMNLFQAFSESLVQTYRVTELMVVIIAKLIKGDISTNTLGGPIMIAQMAGDSAKAGVGSLISFIAVISINLAIINLLPIPVLDGGHLLFFAIEAVKGRPVSIKVREVAQQVGLFILILLMILVFYNDITRIFFS